MRVVGSCGRTAIFGRHALVRIYGNCMKNYYILYSSPANVTGGDPQDVQITMNKNNL